VSDGSAGDLGLERFVERAVRTIREDAARCPTVREADAFLMAIRDELASHLSRLRRERRDPRLVAAFARLLGRLHDEMESGGTRR